MIRRELGGSKSVERLLNFSDAVVAVAITILALPLVDIAAPEPGQTVMSVLSAHLGQIVTFITTFLVVAVMWRLHNRIMSTLAAYDGVVFWLNTAWLIGFVVLPWPAAMHGGGDAAWGSVSMAPLDTSGTGVFYWLTLAYISATGSLMGWYLTKHPELLTRAGVHEMSEMANSRARYRGLLFTFVFVVAALASLVGRQIPLSSNQSELSHAIVDWLGFYALILMWPIAIWVRRGRPRESQVRFPLTDATSPMNLTQGAVGRATPGRDPQRRPVGGHSGRLRPARIISTRVSASPHRHRPKASVRQWDQRPSP